MDDRVREVIDAGGEGVRCVRCGYALRGLESGVCPECGWQISVRMLERLYVWPMSGKAKFLQGVVLALCVTSVIELFRAMPMLRAQLGAGLMPQAGLIVRAVLPVVCFGLATAWVVRLRSAFIVLSARRQALVVLLACAAVVLGAWWIGGLA